MMASFEKALDGKTDKELLEIVVLALTHNNDALLSKVSANYNDAAENSANSTLVVSVVNVVRKRFDELESAGGEKPKRPKTPPPQPTMRAG